MCPDTNDASVQAVMRQLDEGPPGKRGPSTWLGSIKNMIVTPNVVKNPDANLPAGTQPLQISWAAVDQNLVLQVAPTDSIADVKVRIYQRTSLPTEWQTLRHGDQDLSNDHLLSNLANTSNIITLNLLAQRPKTTIKPESHRNLMSVAEFVADESEYTCWERKEGQSGCNLTAKNPCSDLDTNLAEVLQGERADVDHADPLTCLAYILMLRKVEDAYERLGANSYKMQQKIIGCDKQVANLFGQYTDLRKSLTARMEAFRKKKLANK